MAHHLKRRIGVFLVYLLLSAGIAWQTFALAGAFEPGNSASQARSYKVAVNGDVRRPGLYRVPEGTTHFEILKVAGVRPTSDLSAINLMSTVGENGEVTVGSRSDPAGITTPAVSVRFEFFLGDVTITGKDGRDIPVKDGIGLGEGDRIQTDLSSQAELSLGSFSRVDLDAFTELTLDRISAQEEGQTVIDLFQKAGACWYKIAYAGKNESFTVTTPATGITIDGSGADFLADIQPDRTVINLQDGRLTLERSQSTESINLISGQTATIYNDGRPIQVERLAPDMSPAERFGPLSREKKSAVTRGMPVNFLFCGTPAVFILVSAQFDREVVYTVSIPPRLQVGQFAQGIQTLDEAYLYGGPTLVTSLLERVFSVRLTRHLVFTKDNVLKAVDILGGVNLNLGAASGVQPSKSAGQQKLTSANLTAFLSSGGPPEEAPARQRQLFSALFDGMRDRSIVLTPVTTGQILAMVQSNFSTDEVMDYYLRLSTTPGIKQRQLTLPVQEQRIRGRLAYEPDLERCGNLLQEE
ncbi:MAG: SLBB domain-containing protein [Chitinispirillaceae bacterium]|nr:SLBB domain-containing protein [Chitinispirillaceae bacterium]